MAGKATIDFYFNNLKSFTDEQNVVFVINTRVVDRVPRAIAAQCVMAFTNYFMNLEVSGRDNEDISLYEAKIFLVLLDIIMSSRDLLINNQRFVDRYIKKLDTFTQDSSSKVFTQISYIYTEDGEGNMFEVHDIINLVLRNLIKFKQDSTFY